MMMRKMTTKKYFGTDGIRGTVGLGVINPMFMLQLGHAVGQVLRRTNVNDRPTVLIGKDTRISGYMIESALEAGLISAGVDVVLTGPLPTPGVAYLTRAGRADLGIVISASHNPYPDNGIKFFSARGEKLPAEWELMVEAQIDEQESWATSANLGRARRLNDASGRYLEFCKSTFDPRLSLRGLKLIVDAAHGAAYHVAPDVFHELGADVACIACNPDGLNINDGVGATQPEALVKTVIETGADYGIALDGDADRLIMVGPDGAQYDGDQLLYIMAMDRIRTNQPVEGVVGTVMTNMGIENAFLEKGIEFARSKVGDKFILEELLKRNWVLGGESSGHLLALDKHSTGDGMIAALQVLQAIVRTQKPISQLIDAELMPQALLNVPIEKGAKWETQELKDTVQRIEELIGKEGRVLLRASGTEPVVRVMVEHQDAETAKTLSEAIAVTLTANLTPQL